MPLQRRSLLKTLGAAGLAGLASPREQKAQEQVARATRAMPIPKIKDISVIECQPEGVRLTVVKITTDQDGLYGYGCATFTQRADLVKPAVRQAPPVLARGWSTGPPLPWIDQAPQCAGPNAARRTGVQ